MTSECKRRRIEDGESCILRKHPSVVRRSETHVYEGDTIDLFSLLFSQHRDFLITNDDARQVRAGDLRGKAIIVFMYGLKFDIFDGLLVETFHLIETYHDLWPKGGFEVVLVPIQRGDASYSIAQERFNLALSAMPWPAVPLSDQLACDRIQLAFGRTNLWVMVSPKGKVLTMCSYGHRRFSDYYGGPDLPFGGTKRLDIQDKTSIMGVINLDQLLATPNRDYLLAKDGSKVPISSLKDKVVGLYFCDYDAAPRLEAITKVYQEALNLGYNFEIVQINFHFQNRCKYFLYIDHLPLKPFCRNVPWLTLPFKDSCVRRLRRIFRCHKGTAGDTKEWSGLGSWLGDRLVIIHPHETSIKGTFFELHGADVIQHFGIEAYPFTLDRVISLEHARRRQEIKLQLLFSPAGPPLLRHRRGRVHEQVPVSHLWGKRVMILFADHLQCTSTFSELVASLESEYLKQQGLPNGDKFEVVYVSNDPEPYTFDQCTKKMPWLVHPYSFEFACMCRSKVFITVTKNQVPAIAAFNEDGEFLVKQEFYWHGIVLSGRRYPYMDYPTLECEILNDVGMEYKFYTGLYSLLKFDQNMYDLESDISDDSDDN